MVNQDCEGAEGETGSWVLDIFGGTADSVCGVGKKWLKTDSRTPVLNHSTNFP